MCVCVWGGGGLGGILLFLKEEIFYFVFERYSIQSQKWSILTSLPYAVPTCTCACMCPRDYCIHVLLAAAPPTADGWAEHGRPHGTQDPHYTGQQPWCSAAEASDVDVTAYLDCLHCTLAIAIIYCSSLSLLPSLPPSLLAGVPEGSRGRPKGSTVRY